MLPICTNEDKSAPPLIEVIIPRLKLLACLISARLAGTIIGEMKIDNLKTLF